MGVLIDFIDNVLLVCCIATIFFENNIKLKFLLKDLFIYFNDNQNSCIFFKSVYISKILYLEILE